MTRDTNHPDAQSGDAPDDEGMSRKIHPFAPNAADGECRETPFVPTQDPDTPADVESDDGPTPPTYGEVLVSVLGEVFGR